LFPQLFIVPETYIHNRRYLEGQKRASRVISSSRGTEENVR
jgi:hypothetical protein